MKTETRDILLTEFPLKDQHGRIHTAQMVQKQSWLNSLSNPRWIDGDTVIQIDGEELVKSDSGKWENPETGETFSTA